MIYKNARHFEGLDHSGDNKVLPPTFEGIPSLVARLGSPDRVADVFPDRSQQELPDNLFNFLAEWKTADKVDRELLVQDYNDYILQLQQEEIKRRLKPKDSGATTAQTPAQDMAPDTGENGGAAAPPPGLDTPL